MSKTSVPVRRANAVPLYHQIFLALRDDILQGRLPFGASIPTEHELAARYGVSRITARRAVHELADSRLVERRRRIGTRVIYRTSTAPIETNVDQAIETLLAFGRKTPVHVLDLRTEPAPPGIANMLERPVAAPLLRARRIRQLDGAPLGLVTSWLPADLGVELSRKALAARPILDLLKRRGLEIGGGRQTISAQNATPELAALLDIEPWAAVLRIERVIIGVDQRPILLTSADYRADRYRISLDLHGAAQPALS